MPEITPPPADVQDALRELLSGVRERIKTLTPEQYEALTGRRLPPEDEDDDSA